LVRKCFCTGGCRGCAIVRALFGAGLGSGAGFVSIFDSTGGSDFGGSLGDAVHAIFGTVRSAIHDTLLVRPFCFILDSQKHDHEKEKHWNDGRERDAAQAPVSAIAAHA
jgi:hypothetical protein